MEVLGGSGAILEAEPELCAPGRSRVEDERHRAGAEDGRRPSAVVEALQDRIAGSAGDRVRTTGAGSQLAHAGRVVSPSGPRKQIILRMGAPPPNPRDLSLFSSRMDGFLFTESASRSTIERLDRRIGQRRDATRAPTPARNGWRSSGRPLGPPSAASAAPSKDTRTCARTSGLMAAGGSRRLGPFAHFQNQIQERKSAAVRPPLHSLFRITLCWKREPDFRIILGLENAGGPRL